MLACLSPLAANQRVIHSAAKCARLYNARLSAIFIETTHFTKMTQEERKILKENMRIAESYGAEVITLQGDNAYYLISEHCRLTGVTHLVLGRSYLASQRYYRTRNLADKLRNGLPNVEVHMVANPSVRTYPSFNYSPNLTYKGALKDVLVCASILTISVLIGRIFDQSGYDDANIVSLFILAVVLCCWLSRKVYMCIICSVTAILLFDYMFVAPRGQLITYNPAYLMTFATTFISAIILGTLTQRLKTGEAMAAQSSYRTKVLFDAHKQLQKWDSPEKIIETTIEQVANVTGCSTAFLKYDDGKITDLIPFNLYRGQPINSEKLLSEKETALAACRDRTLKGASTLKDHESSFLYFPCYTAKMTEGAVAVDLQGQVLDNLVSSVTAAIVSEGALALENARLLSKLHEADLNAHSAAIRTNLLRAMSHDIRTPLTVISGSADNLRSGSESLSESEKQQAYDEIYENSIWLTNLVENLLTASHFENGTIEIHPQVEMIADIIEDVLQRPIHGSKGRPIEVDIQDEYLMAKMDPQMISRLLHNLVTNAVENTNDDVRIGVTCYQDNEDAVIEVFDEGSGIDDSMKSQVFDMFYIGNRKIVDSRKSMGLGLFLCRNIANAHDGSLQLLDNEPHGCRFVLRLPLVTIDQNLTDDLAQTGLNESESGDHEDFLSKTSELRKISPLSIDTFEEVPLSEAAERIRPYTYDDYSNDTPQSLSESGS